MGKSGHEEVDQFLAELDHPLLNELKLVRENILGADEGISEGIKWKVPSFFYNDWFATIHVRSKDSVQLIFHTGAKLKASSVNGLEIDDPDGLLKWLAKDRCQVDLGADVELKRQALEHIVRQWIKYL